jgi:hypothetical protein
MLVERYVATPNSYNNCCKFSTSDAFGLMNKAVSSTYMLVRSFTSSALMGCSRPRSVAMSGSCCSGSMTRMKSSGDNESPCLRLLPCLIGPPAVPFRRMREEEVLHSRERMSRHRWLKPSCFRTSSRYSQRTLLNALVMSSLMNNMDVLERWKWRMAPCTYWKLSCIDLSRMNVLCPRDTNDPYGVRICLLEFCPRALPRCE